MKVSYSFLRVLSSMIVWFNGCITYKFMVHGDYKLALFCSLLTAIVVVCDIKFNQLVIKKITDVWKKRFNEKCQK